MGLVLVASAALAHAEQPKRAVPAGQQESVVVVEVVSPGPELDSDELRAAVARELGVRTVERAQSNPVRGTLRVRFTGPRRAIMSYTGSTGRTLERSVVLPEEQDRALEVIVLLSGNLARDEAAELVEELRREARPSDTKSEPSAEAPADAPSEPEPPRDARVGEERERPRDERRAPEATPSRSDEQLADDGFTFNASLFHPISLYSDSDKRRVELEVGLAYGRLGALRGFGITFGFTRVDQELNGVLMSAFYNRVGARPTGCS